MSRILLLLFLLTVTVFAADPAVPPPKTDFLDNPIFPIAVLFLVAFIMTLVAVPVCILLLAVFVFGLVMLLKMLGVPPQALLMKLVQRQMMGKNKGLVWQLAALICLPSGIAGLWLATRIFSQPAQTGSLLICGLLCGAVVGFGFIKLTKVIARRAAQRMMGGGNMQAQMMAQMMKLRGQK